MQEWDTPGQMSFDFSNSSDWLPVLPPSTEPLPTVQVHTNYIVYRHIHTLYRHMYTLHVLYTGTCTHYMYTGTCIITYTVVTCLLWVCIGGDIELFANQFE